VKRNLTLWLLLTAAFALFVAASPAFAGQFQVGKPVYWVDGVAHTMDVAPFLDERGRTMVPVRYLAYALGVPEDGVFWRGKDQVVFLNRGDAGLFLVVGEPVLLVVPGPEAALLARLFRLEDLIAARGEEAAREEIERALEEHPELEELLAVDEEDLEAWLAERAEAIEMDTVPVLKQGRVFLPARFVAQAFGYRVAWEPEEQKVVLTPAGQAEAVVPSAPPGEATRTAGPERGTVRVDPEQVIAVYRYAGGVLVGVAGRHWFLSLAGGKPALLTITDPDTGKQRQYDPSGSEWRQDPVVVRFGLAGHIEGVMRNLELERFREQTRQWQMEETLRRAREVEEQERWRRFQEQERQRQWEEQQRRLEQLLKPPVTQPYSPPSYTPPVPRTPPTYTPTVPYAPPTYSPTRPWSPGGTRW